MGIIKHFQDEAPQYEGMHQNWKEGKEPVKSVINVIMPKIKPGKEKEALNCLEIAAKDLKQKVIIDYNPRINLWTVKIGFLWGRDSDLVVAARDCLKKIVPLLKK